MRLLILFLFYAHVTWAQTDKQREQALAAGLNPALLFPTKYPDRIILNLTEDPLTSVAVNWRTDLSQTTGWVQFAQATKGTQFLQALDSVASRVESLTVSYPNEPDVSALYHSVVLTGLVPGTQYVYRVGNGPYWSEWFQFSIPEKSTSLSFLYFGDAQNDVRAHWSRILRNAFRVQPHVDFILHAGDLINRNNHDIEWGEWFYAGGFIHATIPSAMTPGNHEYGKGPILSPQWKKQFTLPENGPPRLEETSFEVNYDQLKLVVLDATLIYDFPEVEAASARWLDSLLTNNPRPWTVVMVHFPLYSTKANRDNPRLREVFQPLFDKHQVDMVLQGHDHAYGRGIREVSGHSTTYVVSNAGPKMYEAGDNKDWMIKKADRAQLFQVLHLENNRLVYKAYMADGTLFDHFELQKNHQRKTTVLEKTITAE